MTAFYLAKGGFKPLVLERREMVGGGAVTEEFHPGFRVSTLAHTVGPLRADIARDMRLEKFGLHVYDPDPRVFAPTPDGKALLFYNDHAKTAGGIAHLSAKDAANYTKFADALEQVAEVCSQIASITPPDIESPSPEDLWNLFKTGRNVRGLGKEGIFNLLRWGPMAAADFVAEFFDTEIIRAVIAARGIFGTALGPWSAGSTAVLLLRAAADPHPVGTAAFPRGGLGSLATALADAARHAGAEIRTDAEVQHIRIKNGGVTSVVLSDGEEIPTEAVVSGVDPKRTFFNLVDPSQLDPTFALRIRNVRAAGTVAKVNLALNDLPTFPALTDAVAPDGFLRALSGRIHIGPEIDYLERAFDASKYGEFSVRAISRCHHSHAARSVARARRQARAFRLRAIRAVQIETGRLEQPPQGSRRHGSQNACPPTRRASPTWLTRCRSSRRRISKPHTVSPAGTSSTASSRSTSSSPCAPCSTGRATRLRSAASSSAAPARIPAMA